MSKSKPTLNKLDEEAIWNGIKQFARDPRGVTNYLKKDTLGRIGRTISDKVKGAFEPVDRVRAAQNRKTFYDSSKGGEIGIIDVRNPKFFGLIKKYFAIGEELGHRFLQDIKAGKISSTRVNTALADIQSFFNFLKSRDSSNYQNTVSQWSMRDDVNKFMREPSIGIPINVRNRIFNDINLAFSRAVRGGANKVVRSASENWRGEDVTSDFGQFERISDEINNFATYLDGRINKIKEQPLSEDELKEINSKIGQAKITLKRFIDLLSKSNDAKSLSNIKLAYEKLHKLEDLEGELNKYMESPEERNKSLEEIENYVNVEAPKKLKDILSKVQTLGTKINDAYVVEYKRQLSDIESELDNISVNTLDKYYNQVSSDPLVKEKVSQIKSNIKNMKGVIKTTEDEIDKLVGDRSLNVYREQLRVRRDQLDKLTSAVSKLQPTDKYRRINASNLAKVIFNNISGLMDSFKQKYKDSTDLGTRELDREIERAFDDASTLIAELNDLRKQEDELEAKKTEEEKSKSAEAIRQEIINTVDAPIKEISNRISNYKTSKNPEIKRNIEAQISAVNNRIAELRNTTESGSQAEGILNSASDRLRELDSEFKSVLADHSIKSIENDLRIVGATIKRANERIQRIASNGYNEEDELAVNNLYTAAETALEEINAELEKLPKDSDEVKSIISTSSSVADSLNSIKQDLSRLGVDDATSKVVKDEETKINSLINKLKPDERELKSYSGKLDRGDITGNPSEDINNKIVTAKANVEEAENLIKDLEGKLTDKAATRLSKKLDKLNELVASVGSLVSSVETKRKTAEDGSRDEALANFIRGTEYATKECASIKKLIDSGIARKAEDIEDYDQVKRLYNAYKRTLENATDFLNRNYPDWESSENEKAVTLAKNIQVLQDELKGLRPGLKNLYNVRFDKEIIERKLIELEELAKTARSEEKLKGIYKEADVELRRLGKFLPDRNLKRIDRNIDATSKQNLKSARKRLSALKRVVAQKIADLNQKKKNETFDDMISRLLQSARLLESAAPDALDSAISALDQAQPQVDPTQPQQPQEPALGDPVMNTEPPPEPTMDLQQDPQVEVSGLAPDADPRGVELDEPTHKSGEHSTRKVMSAVRKALETEVDQLAMNIARASKWPDKAAKKAIDITSDKSKRDILTKVKANLKGNMDKKLESILQECAILEKKMNKSKAKASAKAKKDTKKKADKKADKKPKKMKECVGSMSKYFESACVLDEAKAKDKKKKTGDSSKYIFGKSDKKKR